MKLIDLVTEDLILLETMGDTKEQIVREMVQLIDNNNGLQDKDLYEKAVFEREEISTTGIGFGVAIPHGKSEGVTKATVAFAKHQAGVDWQSLDDEPVHLIFLIAVPTSNAGDDHLKILQLLSRKLIHDEFREGLLKATTKEQVLEILKTVE